MNIYDKLSLLLVVFMAFWIGFWMINVMDYRREVHEIGYDVSCLMNSVDQIEKRLKINNGKPVKNK